VVIKGERVRKRKLWEEERVRTRLKWPSRSREKDKKKTWYDQKGLEEKGKWEGI